MLLSRNQFFLLLWLLFVAPFYFCKILWISGSRQASGLVLFMGHTLELNGSISQHLVVSFAAGKDSVIFNAGDNLGFHAGDAIPVRYQKNDPSDARVNIPVCIWGDAFVNSLLPILVLLVLYFTPARFDPLIPRKASVRIGIKPFIKIIPYDSYFSEMKTA